jgi:hypothetical protein
MLATGDRDVVYFSSTFATPEPLLLTLFIEKTQCVAVEVLFLAEEVSLPLPPYLPGVKSAPHAP